MCEGAVNIGWVLEPLRNGCIIKSEIPADNNFGSLGGEAKDRFIKAKWIIFAEFDSLRRRLHKTAWRILLWCFWWCISMSWTVNLWSACHEEWHIAVPPEEQAMIQSITALSSPMGGISYFELSFVEQLTCLACLSRCSSNPQRRKRPPAFNSIPNSSFQVSVQAYVHEDKTAFQYMVITITFTNTKGWSLKYFLSLSSIHFIIIILDSF